MTDKTEIYKALSALVAYDPETGLFIWKRREEITRWDKAFNAQFAGRECGSIDKHGYQVIGFSHEGKLNRLKAHRLAWLIVHGKLPDGEIDHIKRNRADNRIANIRDVSRAINHRNVSMLRNNTSGVTGVCWHKTKGKWQARAQIEGRYRHIGLFTCIHEAESAVKAFREKHGFTDSHGDAST